MRQLANNARLHVRPVCTETLHRAAVDPRHWTHVIHIQNLKLFTHPASHLQPLGTHGDTASSKVTEGRPIERAGASASLTDSMRLEHLLLDLTSCLVGLKMTHGPTVIPVHFHFYWWLSRF